LLGAGCVFLLGCATAQDICAGNNHVNCDSFAGRCRWAWNGNWQTSCVAGGLPPPPPPPVSVPPPPAFVPPQPEQTFGPVKQAPAPVEHSYLDTRCPIAFNTGAVGSCKIWNCAASRGPTHCYWGSCYCNTGYCRYPSSTLHIQARYCVARIPAATCHLSRFCWSGGFSDSFCENGLCMCKWNSHPVLRPDGKYDCKLGQPDGPFLLAANMSQQELRDIQEDSARAVATNQLVGALWLSAALALAAIGTFVGIRRYRSSNKVENVDYEQLLS